MKRNRNFHKGKQRLLLKIRITPGNPLRFKSKIITAVEISLLE
ncbi:hypothetical protein ACYSNM_08090 [Myroides sp. LJL116]